MASDAITLLVVGVLALALLALASSVALVVHHATSKVLLARHESRANSALVMLAPFIVDGEQLAEMADVANVRFGHTAVADVLRRARNDLAGRHATALTAALERIGEVHRLQRLARSRLASRRRTAIRHLGECGGARACETLVRALEDGSWEVRRAARDGLLSDASEPSIRRAVESYLAEKAHRLDWRRSFYARFAVVAPGRLCALVRSGTLSGDEEKHAIDALGHGRVTEAIPIVRPRLSAGDAELRASAARFAGKLGDAASVPALVQRLDDPEWFVRAAAARALEKIDKPPAALDALGRCLRDPSWWVRANAARALARAGTGGRAVLAAAIDGSDAYAHDAALTALAMQRVVDGPRAEEAPSTTTSAQEETC